MRVSNRPPRYRFLMLLAGFLLATLGALLLTQRPGLLLEYYASPMGTQTDPVFRDIGMPQLGSRGEVAGVLVSQEIFHLRWRGWLAVERSGVYQFFLKADESSYLQLDREVVVATARSSRSALSDGVYLEEGLHPLEIGFSQTGGRARLETRWGAVDVEPELLQGSGLVARRPAGVRAILQGWLSSIKPGLPLRVIGILVGVTGLVLLMKSLHPLRPALDRGLGSIRKWVRVPSRKRAMHALFLLALFVGTFILALPYTASTTDGDDIRYMDGARFNKQMGWNMNRYAHIYALKAFIWSTDGNSFQASRLYWAFSFGATVLALAVAVRALGTGLQVGSLAAALFLLIAQPYVFGGIGAAYADYSAMMFVALGLAVYAHGYSRRDSSPSPWHAVLLGVLAVAAAKSKEPGLIALWFALGLLWSGGRVDWRGFGRRLAWWTAGAAGAYLVLMTLDGLILGDFWFSLRLESVAGAQRLKDAAEGIWQLPRWAWLEVAWTSGSLRYLSALAVLAAAVSLIRPWSPEHRWIAWMPLAFMAMMIAIHPAISSPRYLFPIVPVTCFVGAMLLHDLSSGSDSWKSPRCVRAAGLTFCLMALFGAGFLDTSGALSRHRTAQRGNWTLYPWEVFREEIEAARPKEIVVSPRMYRTLQMMGKAKTRDRIARLFFQRKYLKLRERRAPGPPTGMAVISGADFKRWLEADPDLRQRAVFDPSGRIVLVHPE